MKKFLPLFSFLILSVFSFALHVNADETYNLSSEMFDQLSILPDIISASDNYLSSHPNLKDYLIYYYDVKWNNTISYQVYFSQWENFAYINVDTPNTLQINTSNVRFKYDTSTSSLVSWSDSSNNISTYLDTEYITGCVLYSKLGIQVGIPNTSGYTYIFNYSDKTYTFLSDGINYFPTIDDLYDIWFSEPPDDTPLLSSFVDLVIEKVSYMCEFITSSYIYLSIFVIFILYFIILLFRRLQ